jgi:hypothetical protein
MKYFVIAAENCVPSLWVGTNGGVVFIHQLVYMTDAKDQGPIQCRCFLGEYLLMCLFERELELHTNHLETSVHFLWSFKTLLCFSQLLHIAPVQQLLPQFSSGS